jgi:ribosomal protein S3AE
MAQTKRKKKFFDVEIPLIGKTTHLYAYEKSEIKNRFINYDLTRFLKGKNMIIKLKPEIQEDEIKTIPYEIRLLPCYLKRMVRKGTNYVEDSFSTPCTNAQIKIKPFLITRRKVSRAVRKALRKKTKEELINYAKDKTTEEIFDDILKNKLQKQLSIILKKIYPLSLCEIRILKVEKFRG